MMTEYETATLALVPQDSLSVLFVGPVTAGLIAGEMRVGCRAARNRDDGHRAIRAAFLRHGFALRIPIERTAPPAR